MAAADENRITYFGVTDTRSRRTPFGIKAQDRTKHVYVIGKTGMGKSTMLENMAIQDIQNGEGIAFVDPHGSSADKLLDFVPENRIKDVLYFAPFDMEYPIAFNIMEDIGADKRHLVVAGLMSTFKKIWIDAWSARMEYILQNTLLALLEYPGATLLGVNKMLSDKDYRKKVVENIKDPATRSFWVDEFAKYTERFAAEAVPAIQNKVGQFTSNPLIRNIIGQSKSSFDLRKIMDEKKILIVNLSKGLVGEGNASLLGGMLITKIYLAAMSRADMPEEVVRKLPNFYLYVDEFQSFANESFADILSEARKYKLNLTMAHQYVEQMVEEVQAAVFGNVGTMIAFRVGAIDSELLEKEFAPQFTAEDLVNLGARQIYLKLMIDGVSSQPFSATTAPPIEKPKLSFKDSVIANSKIVFGRIRRDVEEEILNQMSDQAKKASGVLLEENKPLPMNSQNERPKITQKSNEFERNNTSSGIGSSNVRGTEGLRSALASVITDEKLPPLKRSEPSLATPNKALPTQPIQTRSNPVGQNNQTRQNINVSFNQTNQNKIKNNYSHNQANLKHAHVDGQSQHIAPPLEGNKSLKDAINDLMKNESLIHKPEVDINKFQDRHEKDEEKKQEINTFRGNNSNPNEIPESKLREMLDVKDK